MKRLFLLIAMSFTLLGASFAQMEQMMQPLPLDPGTKVGKLPNGLTYYIRHNEYPKDQAFFYIAQKVGSVLEEDDQRGLAHFLEHMCFNGTENFPENGVIRYLETIGVKFGEQLNAYTSIDQTVYNIDNVPTAREATIDSVLLILHDWSHNLTLDPKEIDKERGVIHEEWRSRSTAQQRILERQLPKLMSNSRPGNRLPIGTMEVVDNFKPETLRAYYEKWYRPDQQGIIVVGDLDVDRTEQQIKAIFGDITMPENPAERVYFSVPDNAEPIVVSDKDKEQTVAMTLVMSKHEDLFPTEYKNTVPYLMTSLMINAATSMMNTRFSEMALDPEVPFIQAGVDDGDFLLAKVTKCFETMIVPKESRMDEAVTKVMSEVYRAAEHGFTASEYSRWSNEFMSRLESQYENKDKRQSPSFVNECVNNFLDNEPMPGLDTEYMLCKQILPNVPVEAINQVFAQLVSQNDSNLVILNMNPEKEGYVQPTEEGLLAAVHAAQNLHLEAYVDNVKNEPLIAKLPKAGKIKKEQDGQFGSKVLTLSNGVKVVLKKTDYKDNEVIMHAFSEGGSGRYGLEDKYTLRLYGDFINSSGWGNFTSTELSKALAGIQASVGISLSNRYEYLSGNSVPKDLRTMFELIYLHFQQPLRDDKAVASMLQSTAQALRNQSANPMKALQDTLQTTVYGNNPRLVLLKEEDLSKASYDRALEIYKDRYADASDFTFVFLGNFDNDSIRQYCAQYLANLPKVKRNDKAVDNKMNPQDGMHENVFRNKMEQPSCTLVEYLGCASENTLKNQVTSTIIGEVLSMRLLEKIREEMGAAYSVGAQCDLSSRSDGSYAIALQMYAPIKPETLDTCRQVIDQEIQAMAENGAEDQYVSKVKEYLLKNYKEGERKNSAWLSYITDYYQDGLDEYTTYEEVVKNVSNDDIKAMTAQILAAKNKIVVAMLPEE